MILEVANLNSVRRGAARVGRVAGSVEQGLEAASGLVVDLRRGIRMVVKAAQSMEETSQALKETNERLAALESKLEEKLRTKEESSG